MTFKKLQKTCSNLDAVALTDIKQVRKLPYCCFVSHIPYKCQEFLVQWYLKSYVYIHVWKTKNT